MKLNEYQARAMKFAKYKTPDYPFLALGEESGEVLGKLAKQVRKQGIDAGPLLYSARSGEQEELREALAKELGDTLWQLSACAEELAMSLEDIAMLNLEKLGDRDVRGVIVGEGDER